jgi:hypothetical protein
MTIVAMSTTITGGTGPLKSDLETVRAGARAMKCCDLDDEKNV